jgi:hypothetical protein
VTRCLHRRGARSVLLRRDLVARDRANLFPTLTSESIEFAVLIWFTGLGVHRLFLVRDRSWTSGDHAPAVTGSRRLARSAQATHSQSSARTQARSSRLFSGLFPVPVPTARPVVSSERRRSAEPRARISPRKTNNRELRAYAGALDCEWVVSANLVSRREPVTGGRAISRGPNRSDVSVRAVHSRSRRRTRGSLEDSPHVVGKAERRGNVLMLAEEAAERRRGRPGGRRGRGARAGGRAGTAGGGGAVRASPTGRAGGGGRSRWR